MKQITRREFLAVSGVAAAGSFLPLSSLFSKKSLTERLQKDEILQVSGVGRIQHHLDAPFHAILQAREDARSSYHLQGDCGFDGKKMQSTLSALAIEIKFAAPIRKLMAGQHVELAGEQWQVENTDMSGPSPFVVINRNGQTLELTHGEWMKNSASADEGRWKTVFGASTLNMAMDGAAADNAGTRIWLIAEPASHHEFKQPLYGGETIALPAGLPTNLRCEGMVDQNLHEGGILTGQIGEVVTGDKTVARNVQVVMLYTSFGELKNGNIFYTQGTPHEQGVNKIGICPSRDSFVLFNLGKPGGASNYYEIPMQERQIRMSGAGSEQGHDKYFDWEEKEGFLRLSFWESATADKKFVRTILRFAAGQDGRYALLGNRPYSTQQELKLNEALNLDLYKVRLKEIETGGLPSAVFEIEDWEGTTLLRTRVPIGDTYTWTRANNGDKISVFVKNAKPAPDGGQVTEFLATFENFPGVSYQGLPPRYQQEAQRIEDGHITSSGSEFTRSSIGGAALISFSTSIAKWGWGVEGEKTGCGPDIPLCPLTPPLEAYPNPFQEKLTLSFGLEQPAKVGIRLFDLGGRMVLRVEPAHVEAGKSEVVVPIHDLAAGTYRVQLDIDGKIGQSVLLIHDH